VVFKKQLSEGFLNSLRQKGNEFGINRKKPGGFQKTKPNALRRMRRRKKIHFFSQNPLIFIAFR